MKGGEGKTKKKYDVTGNKYFIGIINDKITSSNTLFNFADVT